MDQKLNKIDKAIKDEIKNQGHKELVVYVLGAGFSVPLGIPVMNNFVSKSKNQFLKDTEKYKKFSAVFKKFGELYKVKNFFSSDLDNIEEILSILEMETYLKSSDSKLKSSAFIDYLCDVIEEHTPSLNPKPFPNALVKNLFNAFGNRPPDLISRLEFENVYVNRYALFVAQLLNLEVQPTDEIGIAFHDPAVFAFNHTEQPEKLYSVVTLNYDMVLENICAGLNDTFKCELGFRKSHSDKYNGKRFRPYLSKLHGCVSDRKIVPPTWAKSGVENNIREAWALARSLLANAKHIRILGYSLPQSDNYVKYLFKLASLDSFNLESIDILCKDADGSVKKRYNEFFEFKDCRFLSGNIEDYLAGIVIPEQKEPNKFRYKGLERRHSDFFKEAERLKT
jgi:hypothetical protein